MQLSFHNFGPWIVFLMFLNANFPNSYKQILTLYFRAAIAGAIFHPTKLLKFNAFHWIFSSLATLEFTIDRPFTL